jgi:hypothetical protein
MPTVQLLVRDGKGRECWRGAPLNWIGTHSNIYLKIRYYPLYKSHEAFRCVGASGSVVAQRYFKGHSNSMKRNSCQTLNFPKVAVR